MLIGYARTSTLEQEAGLEAQLRDLNEIGCDKVFQEQVSSVAQRPELNRALEFLREGDVLYVTKLDRLARSMKHLGDIVDTIKGKGAYLKVLDNLGLDTTTATGELVLNVLGSVAQFERSMMLERQREGIAKAKAQGKYTGRQKTAQAKSKQVFELKAQGIKPNDIAKQLGISRASVYRIIKAGDE
ncbi:MAG: recombinase family protein [Methylocystaceae bacterium]|nr:recombinase family protein [Methylocystaceae bacterium]